MDRIDDIRKRLYIKGDKTVDREHFGTLHEDGATAPKDWADISKKEIKTPAPIIPKQPKTKKTPLKKFFLVSVVIFLVAMAYVGYIFLGGSNSVSNDNIAIAISGNTFTNGGEDLPLSVEIKNNNSVALELADLIVEYPKGSATASPADLTRTRFNLGTVPAGKSAHQDVTIVLYGEQSSSRNIHMSLEYRLHGENAIYTSERDFPITISSAPVTLTVEGPTETNPNQEIVLKIKASLNATKAVPGMLVGLEYPPGFQFTESDPKAAYSNTIFDIGDLKPGDQKTITIKGKLLGEDGETKSFRIYGGAAKGNDKSRIETIFNSYIHTISIQKPFFETHIIINGDSNDNVAISSGENVNISIPWENNLPTQIRDAQIIASISGSAYNPTLVEAGSEGYFDSNNNTITWDKNTVDDFRSVEPGASGSVGFSISSAQLSSGSHNFLKDPSIVVKVSIRGTQVDAGNITREVNGSETKTMKVTSDFHIASQALYSSGPFSNTGPIPPIAGQTSTYTILWSITNTANRITSAEARTTLPSWVTWKGTTSPQNANIAYNSATREVVWKLGTVERGAGLSGTLYQAGFQVSFTPSTSQIDSAPKLISETTLTGIDAFTGKQIKQTKAFLTTKISDDPTYGGDENNWRVH